MSENDRIESVAAESGSQRVADERGETPSAAPSNTPVQPEHAEPTSSAPLARVEEPSERSLAPVEHASAALATADDAAASRKPRKRTRSKKAAEPKAEEGTSPMPEGAPEGEAAPHAPAPEEPANPAADGSAVAPEAPDLPKKSSRKRSRSKVKDQKAAGDKPAQEEKPAQEQQAESQAPAEAPVSQQAAEAEGVEPQDRSKEPRSAKEGRPAPVQVPSVSVADMSLDELMTNLPRRRRGRPSKRDLEARKALEDAIANPTPELVEKARSAAEAIITSSSKKKAKAAPEAETAQAAPADERKAEQAEAPTGQTVEAQEPSAAASPSEREETAPVPGGGYGTRRRHHERRGEGPDERRQKNQGPDQSKQQDRRDRDRNRDQQRQRDNRDGRDGKDGRDRQNGYGNQPQGSQGSNGRQRDGRDNRDRQNGYGNQSQQYGKNNRNGKNGNQRQRDYVVEPKTNREELEELKVSDLRAKATELGIDAAGLKKPELVDAVYSALVKQEGFFEFTGILDLTNEGFGFIRTKGYLASEHDVYIGASIVRQNWLRRGDEVSGIAHVGRPNDKYPAIARVTAVNGKNPEEMRGRPRFGDLTPVFPTEPLRMEHGKDSILGRCIDLVAPIGKGQRGLIVSPPKAGKTTVLKKIAESIAANNPEVHLICLLVDERPEEVTDMQRSIKGEVVASTFDMPSDNHITVSELVIERAKRLVEQGEDVVILLDSITRLARAYNLAQPASGRILSGGVDSTALYPPKRFLGAARNIENGGSLTILASALVDTGSKMDEVIFEEFKGTGNMELKLDRDLADRRIFPAIDPVASGTRKEELLLDPSIAPFVWGIRRILSNMSNNERAMSTLIRSLKATANNEEFLIRSAKKAQNQELGVGEL